MNPDETWFPHLPQDEVEGLVCAPDLPSDEEAEPSDEATSDDPPDSAGCAVPYEQYQPDETQYQTPTSIPCDAPDDSVVPISEPEAPLPSTPVGSNTPAPTNGVSPTTAPVDAPVVPTTEPTEPGTDVVPAPKSSPPAPTKVVANRPTAKPLRTRPGHSSERAETERVIPARARLVSSPPVRPRRVHAPSTRPRISRPRISASRSKVEGAAPQRLVPASSHGSPFGGWLLVALPLSFLFGLGLLVLAAAIVGRSLRARVGSKGLSGHRRGTNSSAGIRYRD